MPQKMRILVDTTVASNTETHEEAEVLEEGRARLEVARREEGGSGFFYTIDNLGTFLNSVFVFELPA